MKVTRCWIWQRLPQLSWRFQLYFFSPPEENIKGKGWMVLGERNWLVWWQKQCVSRRSSISTLLLGWLTARVLAVRVDPQEMDFIPTVSQPTKQRLPSLRVYSRALRCWEHFCFSQSSWEEWVTFTEVSDPRLLQANCIKLCDRKRSSTN